MLKNQNWSILLWSVFLVLFISFSFMHISQGINKKLKQNQSNIFSTSNEQTSQVFTNSFSWTLRNQEKLNFTFSKTNSWTITLIKWWPIYYKTFIWSVFNTWGIITTSKTIQTLSWVTLSTLWWYSKFEIKFNSADWIVFPYNYTKVTTNIWWTDMVKSIITIK